MAPSFSLEASFLILTVVFLSYLSSFFSTFWVSLLISFVFWLRDYFTTLVSTKALAGWVALTTGAYWKVVFLSYIARDAEEVLFDGWDKVTLVWALISFISDGLKEWDSFDFSSNFFKWMMETLWVLWASSFFSTSSFFNSFLSCLITSANLGRVTVLGTYLASASFLRIVALFSTGLEVIFSSYLVSTLTCSLATSLVSIFLTSAFSLMASVVFLVSYFLFEISVELRFFLTAVFFSEAFLLAFFPLVWEWMPFPLCTNPSSFN